MRRRAQCFPFGQGTKQGAHLSEHSNAEGLNAFRLVRAQRGAKLSSTDRPQGIDGNLEFASNGYEFLDQILVFRIVAIVEGNVTLLMAVIKEAPFGRSKGHGAVQNLKDNIAVFRAIPMPAQGRQGERVCRIVGEDEAAVGGQS